jgi:hypothetical protein
MALESAGYISALVSANPTASDGLSQGDDHLRLLKSTLLATFPNFTAAALAATQAMLDAAANPTGKMAPFVAVTTDPGWLRLNGGTFAYTAHPDLGTMLGYSSGTCTLPNLEDTGRFVRSVTSGLAVRTSQANALKTHTHTGTTGTENANHAHSGTTSGRSADHSHTYSGTTSGESATHTHPDGNGGIGSNQDGGLTGGAGSNGALSTGVNSADHTHTYSGTSSGESADHSHTFTTGLESAAHAHTFTTDATGGTETRPEAFAAIWYVHV